MFEKDYLMRLIQTLLDAMFHTPTVVLHYDKPLTNDKIL